MPLIDEHRFRPAATSEPTPDAGPPGTSLLVADDVGKHWPGRPEATLDGLDLELAAGEVVSITGPNGAGKTTLLRILGGLLAPDRGLVELDGLRLGRSRRAYQRRIGLLTPGDRGLYARLTVGRHLDLWARLALLDGPRRDAAIAGVLERFALPDLAGLRVDRLSMGQRQRVRLALAFLHEPALVLLDEPATSLDAAALEILHRAVARATDGGASCLVVGPEGIGTGVPADRSLLLRDGRLAPA
jgi:ABC-2 type transport system ATP-binding protein